MGEPGLSHGSSSHASVVSRVFGSGTGTREWMLAVLVVQADLGGGHISHDTFKHNRGCDLLSSAEAWTVTGSSSSVFAPDG